MKTERAISNDGRTFDFIVVPDPPHSSLWDVYFSPDRKLAVGLVTRGALPPDVRSRFEVLIGKINPTLVKPLGRAASQAEADLNRSLFSWPIALVESPREGVVWPVHRPNFFFVEGAVKGQVKELTWFIRPKLRCILQKTAPAALGTWKNYLEICIHIATAVHALHANGISHPDLGPNSLLIDPENGHACVTQIDSVALPGFSSSNVVGTHGYIAPEAASIHIRPEASRNNSTVQANLHSLAVVLYQLLLLRHPLLGKRIPPAKTAEEQDSLVFGPQAIYCEHPRDDSNRPEGEPYIPASSLGPDLAKLFERAFVQGVSTPEQRPTAAEWCRALGKARDLLTPCDNGGCAAKWFILHDQRTVRCPFCGTEPSEGVMVLRLSGCPETTLVAFDGLDLMPWHVNVCHLPEAIVDRRAQARVVLDHGRWLLVNKAIPTLTSPAGSHVPESHAVLLSPGTKLRLSQESEGRTLQVEIVQPRG